MDKELLEKIRGVARKINRNKLQGFPTDKLDAVFKNLSAQAQKQGIKIKSYKMFT